MTGESISDRRSGIDRRVRQERYQGPDRRSGIDRRLQAAYYGNGAGLRRAELAPAPAPITAKGGVPAAPMVWPFPPSFHEMLERIGGMLTDLVAGFYEASMDARLWPEVLGRLRDAVRADACAILSHDFSSGRGRLEHSVNIDSAYVSAYADYYSECNPWLQRRDSLGEAGSVWTGQQLAIDSEVVETDYHRFWLRPQGLFHHLFGVIEADPGRAQLITFARAADRGAFWQDDIDLLRRLLPLLRRGAVAGRTFHHSQDVRRAALDTLDAMPIAVIIVGAGGSILAANRLARDLIDREDSIVVVGGSLGLRLPGGRVRLRDYLSGPAAAKGGERPSEIQVLSIPRPAPLRPITVLISPIADRAQGLSDDSPMAVVFIGDPERPVEMDPRRLSRLYGLSRAEARVAALLGQGLRLDQVAGELGLTYETVRKHLKQIFAKTATDRQAELVRTLNLGPGAMRI